MPQRPQERGAFFARGAAAVDEARQEGVVRAPVTRVGDVTQVRPRHVLVRVEVVAEHVGADLEVR